VPDASTTAPSSSTDDEITPAPTETTATPPPLPEAASARDQAGAEAFVQHWFDLLNYGIRTGDMDPLREVSASDCSTCRSVASDVEDIYRGGGRVEGNEFEVDVVVSPAPGDDGVVMTTVTYAVEAGIEMLGDGTKKEIPAVPTTTQAAVVTFNDGWTFAGLGTL